MLLFEVCFVLYCCVWIKLCERYDRQGFTPKTIGGGRGLMLVRAENWAANAREFCCGRNAQWHLVVAGRAPADDRVCTTESVVDRSSRGTGVVCRRLSHPDQSLTVPAPDRRRVRCVVVPRRPPCRCACSGSAFRSQVSGSRRLSVFNTRVHFSVSSC